MPPVIPAIITRVGLAVAFATPTISPNSIINPSTKPKAAPWNPLIIFILSRFTNYFL
jgi:hypothetical protein